MASFQPTCKVCDRGTLIKKKIFRMSGPVVTIGFIFLIPSILGIAVGVALAVVTLLPLIGVYVNQPFPDFFGTGALLFIAVPSFVGGLIGWLLVMRKSVLQCTECDATIDAS